MQNTSRVGDFLKNKWVRLGLIIDILVIVAIIIIIIINFMKSSVISFNVAPVDATISVNGDASYSNGTYQFFPGEYEITISHSDLDSKTFNITLDSHSSTEITTFLSKSGNFDFYTLKDNFDSFTRLAAIASTNSQTTDHDTSAESFITEYDKNINLYSSFLPYQNLERNENNAISVFVSLLPLSNEENSCSKYLCIYSSVIGLDDPNYVKNLLRDNGFDLKYLELTDDY